MSLRKYLGWQIFVIVLLPFVALTIKAFNHVVMSGWKYTQSYDLFLQRNLNPAYPAFWWFVISVAIVSLLLAMGIVYNDDEPVAWGGGAISVLLVVVSLVVWCAFVWNNKDVPRFYNQHTTFVVTDIDDPPAALQRLLEGADEGERGCDLVGTHDVPSCINEGEFPTEGWENRSASLAGAIRVMSQFSGESQQVRLLSDTAAHIYPEGEEIAAEEGTSAGYWTAIRDGSGIRIPTEGVVEWDGSGRPTSCEFKGKYELNRALGGQRSNSFTHLIADRFPNQRWRQSDAYGFCDHEHGNQPVIVIPMFRNVRYNHRSVEVPAGVLLVRGSTSGDPRFELLKNVKAGDVPGPVYPLSIAEIQREQHTWAAGREYRTRGRFGFESTEAASQTGNSTEFLLRSRENGRVFWVSPLTPRGSDSQLVLAYAVVPADTVSDGELNELTIYVLDGDDPHVVNLDQMGRDIRDFVSRQNPGFFATDGRIQEFTPASGTSWRAFGVIDDDPRFVVTIDPNGENPLPQITDLYGDSVEPPDDSDSEQPPTEAPSACDKPLAEQTNTELVACAQAVLEELGRREATATATNG